MRSGEDRDADGVRILLDRGLDDLLRRLMETRVDDLHAGVAESPRDDLGAPVVTVETGLRDHYSDLPGHRVGKYMAVRLTVIGCSPAWPNPGGACSGYLVDGRLLLDCGPGVLAKLRLREPWPTVEAIAITHLHLDHWGDLDPVGLGNYLRPRGVDATRAALASSG